MTAPKRFHKAFVELPPAWRLLPYLQRSIIQDLWRLSAADCSGHIEVAGDPVQFLVRMLDLTHRNERAPAVRAVVQLFERGLLSSTENMVTVHPACTQPAPSLHLSRTQPAPIPEANSSESFNTEKQIRREESRKEEIRTPPIQKAPPLALIGYRWLWETMGGNAPDLQSWLSDYEKIGRFPEADRAQVARNLLATPYIAAKRSKATPGHLVRFWQQFVEGPRAFEDFRQTLRKVVPQVAGKDVYVADAATGDTFQW